MGGQFSPEHLYSLWPPRKPRAHGGVVREKVGEISGPRAQITVGGIGHPESTAGAAASMGVTVVCAWASDGSGSALHMEGEALAGVETMVSGADAANDSKFHGKKRLDFPEP